jgi:hypothetical protein
MTRPAVRADRRRRRSRLPVLAVAGIISSTAAASFGGTVPIGAFDVVPDGATSDAQALIGTELTARSVPFTLEDLLHSGTADDVAAGKPSGIERTDNGVDVAIDDSNGAPAQGNAISFIGNSATAFDDTGFVAIDTPARTGVAQGLNRAAIPARPASVPLPAAVYTGVIGLSTVAWAKRRMRR